MGSSRLLGQINRQAQKAVMSTFTFRHPPQFALLFLLIRDSLLEDPRFQFRDKDSDAVGSLLHMLQSIDFVILLSSGLPSLIRNPQNIGAFKILSRN
jgi:hypothetical protein